MQKPDLTHWKDPKGNLGLLLFAQRLNEALFDYTLDSHKVRALNTHTRGYELSHAADMVKEAGLRKATLIPMVEEFAESLGSDPAAKVLLGPQSVRFSHFKEWDLASPKAIEVQVSHVLSLLTNRYEAQVASELRRAVSLGKEKALICRLTADLAVDWMNRGVSRDLIYYMTDQFFFRGKHGNPDTEDGFDRFLSLIPTEPAHWRVVMRGTNSLKKLSEILPEEVCEVSDKPPKARGNGTREAGFLSKPHRGAYVVFPKVSALDPRSALDEAERQLRSFSSLISLHSHRRVFDTDRWGLVYPDQGDPVILQPAVPPVHKHPRGRGHHLRKRIVQTVQVLGPEEHMLPSESSERLLAALDLHATALQARTPEQQLYALWIAMEALLPVESVESRFTSLFGLLTPLLSRKYPVKLLTDLWRDFRRCIPSALEKTTKGLPADWSSLRMCAALVCSTDHQKERDRLFKACEDNPLLRFRIYEISEGLISADRVLSTIAVHSKRVEWHLNRIYRTRNLLVHTGTRLPYTVALVENLHAYLIRLLELVEDEYSDPPRPPDLDTAFLSARVKHEAHLSNLRQAGISPIGTENVESLVLGWV